MQSTDHAIPSDLAATLVDPRAYADGRIFDTYAWLRANNDIGFAQADGYDPFWVITKYDDVRAISRDNRLFPYGDRPSMLTDKASEAFIRYMSGGRPVLAPTLIASDPPIHMKYRLLTQAWFMPKHLKTINDRIAAIADDTVKLMMDRGDTCDFVTDVALHYPLRVIMDILGVPAEDLDYMLSLTQEIFAPTDPDSRPAGLDQADPAFLAQAMKSTLDQIDAYFRKITDDRRQNPRNDIATIIANARIGDRPLTDEEMLGYYTIVATAGHDTTSSSTSAAIHALATQPGLLERVKGDPSLIPALIEEAIRWGSPVKTFMRSVAEDMDFKGRSFRHGDWLMLCYASANRDEDVIDRGELFDIDRPKFDHVAFGFGPHVCLGQHLARREIIMFLERLLPRIDAIELTGDIAYSQSYFVNGLKALPIRVTWKADGAKEAPAVTT